MELLFWTNHRAAINLIGEFQSDLSIIDRVFDLVVRSQLARRVAGSEMNLDLHPERIESISLNSIDDCDKRLSARQAIIRQRKLIELL